MASNPARKDATAVRDSTGNVFADLNLPESDELFYKAQIASAIAATIKKQGLTQVEAGKLIGADQAKVSLLLRGRLTAFSVDRLIRFLTLLGRDVEFKISRQVKSRPGRVRVTGAA
jgi:predicted XRE-type DNA-binding protein